METKIEKYDRLKVELKDMWKTFKKRHWVNKTLTIVLVLLLLPITIPLTLIKLLIINPIKRLLKWI